eukprot:GDKJ01058106.1.p1 GENE.GDKJ01058106.1~~GDKJ01058106.1.p1  ORF type:complete len:165 (-),score=23.54 GDKJ01058106.1:79-573(-)
MDNKNPASDDSPYFLSFVERTMMLSLFVDILLAFAWGMDFLNECDAPLKFWVPVAVFLSFPYTVFIHFVKKRFTIKTVRLLEVLGFIASLLCSVYGSFQVFTSQTCHSTSPYLYWTVYSTSLFAWTVLVTTSVMILWFAVWMTVTGSGEDDIQPELKQPLTPDK